MIARVDYIQYSMLLRLIYHILKVYVMYIAYGSIVVVIMIAPLYDYCIVLV